jgi:hypothetical protein
LQTNVNLKNKSIINFNLNFIKMKKGLLSLLAVALTIVSCQNYDDQFAELTGLVNTLSNDVAGLTQVKDDLSKLSDVVDAIQTTIETDLTGIKGDIQDLEDLLTAVADSQDLGEIVERLTLLQEGVDKLLQSSATVNQPITITNTANLAYASELIDSSEEGPEVLVNGNVTVDTTTLTPTQVVLANAIVAKIKSVIGNVSFTAAAPLTASTLAFINGDYSISGSDMDDAVLGDVTGNVTIAEGDGGALNYSTLKTIGLDVIISAADAASATSVNFEGSNIKGNMTIVGSAGVGVLNFPEAVTIDLGTVSFIELNAAKAISIESGQTGTVTSVTINATKGGTINMNEELKSIGAVAITGGATSVIKINGLTSATTVSCASAGEMHFASLSTITGVTSITAATSVDLSGLLETGNDLEVSAPTVDLSSLGTITHATDLNAVVTLYASSLTTVTHELTIDNGPISLPTAQFSGGTAALLSTTATAVTVGGSDDPTLADVSPASVDHLTLTDQKTDVTSTNATLESLNATVATAGSTATLAITTASTLLKELHTTGYDVVDVNNTAVVTMTTAGTTRNLMLTSNDHLVSLSIGHIYHLSYTDAQRVGINDNDLLTSVDLTSVARLESANIIDNAVLATITAPGIDDLLTVGATVSFTIRRNFLTGTYTNSLPAKQDGITDVPFVEAIVVQPSLATWNTYLTAVSTLNPTMTLDIEYGGGNTVQDFTAFTSASSPTDTGGTEFAGVVDTLAELQAFVAQ